MAKIYARHAFDILDINLNRILANRTDWTFYDNANLRYQGGTYRDGHLTEWSLGGVDFGSLFRSSQLTVGPAGHLRGGTVTSYSEYLWTGSEYSELWGMTGLSLEATALQAAMRSRGRADDDALIQRALGGADEFRLSPDPDIANGFGGNDTLYGGRGNDVLAGGAGNDSLMGQRGNDHLFLDPGNDVISGGPGRDTLQVSGARDVTVRLGLSTRQDTGYGRDLILGIEDVSGGRGNDRLFGDGKNNRLSGNDGNDLLEGQGGNDLLRGGAGNDRLIGGAGTDTLTGGAGADHFIFKTTAEIGRTARTSDVITDFQPGRDVIDLRGIDASTVLAGNNAFLWRGEAAIGTSNRGEIQLVHLDRPGRAQDVTLIRIDTDADRAAEAEIRLHGLLDLTADDFLF